MRFLRVQTTPHDRIPFIRDASHLTGILHEIIGSCAQLLFRDTVLGVYSLSQTGIGDLSAFTQSPIKHKHTQQETTGRQTGTTEHGPARAHTSPIPPLSSINQSINQSPHSLTGTSPLTHSLIGHLTPSCARARAMPTLPSSHLARSAYSSCPSCTQSTGG